MNVLITGIRGNLGTAVEDHFLAKGDKVFGSVLFEKELNAEKNNSTAFIADLTTETGGKKFVDDVIGIAGKIDVSVLTVGGWQPGNLEQSDSAVVQKQFSLNFFTAYHVAKYIHPHMVKNGGGKIFLVGAQPGLHPEKGKDMVGYALSKSLIFSFAKILNSISPLVRTIVIVPSTIDTPENRKAMPKANTSSWIKPEKIASSIGESVKEKVNDLIIEF